MGGARDIPVQLETVTSAREFLEGLGRSDARGGGRLRLVDGLHLVPGEAAALFGPGSPLVQRGVPLVAVAPQLVARWPRDHVDPRFTPLHLPPIPVLGRSAEVSWPAVEQVRSLLLRRLPAGPLLPDPAVLGRVALLSGGVPRDAIRILRSAVLSAARRGSDVRLEDIVAGERELRQDLEQGSLAGDPDILRRTREARQFLDPDPRLLTQGAVLLYEDAEGRYALPHPALWATLGLGHSLAVDLALAAALLQATARCLDAVRGTLEAPAARAELRTELPAEWGERHPTLMPAVLLLVGALADDPEVSAIHVGRSVDPEDGAHAAVVSFEAAGDPLAVRERLLARAVAVGWLAYHDDDAGGRVVLGFA